MLRCRDAGYGTSKYERDDDHDRGEDFGGDVRYAFVQKPNVGVFSSITIPS